MSFPPTCFYVLWTIREAYASALSFTFLWWSRVVKVHSFLVHLIPESETKIRVNVAKVTICVLIMRHINTFISVAYLCWIYEHTAFKVNTRFKFHFWRFNKLDVEFDSTTCASQLTVKQYSKELPHLNSLYILIHNYPCKVIPRYIKVKQSNIFVQPLYINIVIQWIIIIQALLKDEK